jgi:hypothetical protein
MSKTGVVGGLDKQQLLLLAVALVPPLFLMIVVHNLPLAFRMFVFWGLPLGGLAVASWQGRSVLSRVVNEGLFVFRKFGGQTTARPPLRVKSKPRELKIPGAVGERFHILPVFDVAYGTESEQAFVWDKNPVEETATAVLCVQTDGWLLADDTVKAARAQAVNDMCKTMATMGAVRRIATYARTYRASFEKMAVPELMYEASPVGDFTRYEYTDMLSSPMMGNTMRRDMLIAITISFKQAAGEIADQGGDIDGVSAVLTNRVTRIANMLTACGVRSDQMEWLGNEKLRGAVRLAFDPLIAPDLIEQDFRVPENMPLVTSFDEDRGHIVTNQGAHHRTWWIQRWPSTPVHAGVMSQLVAGGNVARTVCQIWEPENLYKSEKRLMNQMQARETAKAVNEKFLGRPETAASKDEANDLALRHHEMQQGYGDVYYSGFVTVHAKDLEELNRAEMWVREASPGMTPEVIWGRQGACFATGALPFGLRDGGV